MANVTIESTKSVTHTIFDRLLYEAVRDTCIDYQAFQREAERLDAQSDEQARVFLADRQRACRLEESTGEVWLSKIFYWSTPNLINRPLPGFLVAPFISKKILETITPFLSPTTQRVLRNGSWRIWYLPYDWRLNHCSSEAATSWGSDESA